MTIAYQQLPSIPTIIMTMATMLPLELELELNMQLLYRLLQVLIVQMLWLWGQECNIRIFRIMGMNIGSRRLLLELEEVVAAAMVTVRWLAAAAAAAGECSAGVGSISVSVQEAAAAAGADAKADHQKQSSISNETMPIIENLLGLILVYRKWRINK